MTISESHIEISIFSGDGLKPSLAIKMHRFYFEIYDLSAKIHESDSIEESNEKLLDYLRDEINKAARSGRYSCEVWICPPHACDIPETDVDASTANAVEALLSSGFRVSYAKVDHHHALGNSITLIISWPPKA